MMLPHTLKHIRLNQARSKEFPSGSRRHGYELVALLDEFGPYRPAALAAISAPYFRNDLACVIHNADARLFDRNVQSSKMVHAALLLLMLEAVFTDLVSPSA